MKKRQNMNRMKYLLGLLIIIAAFGIITSVSANTAEIDVDLEILQTITAMNTDRTDLGCSYILTSETEGAPMPGEAADGKMEFTMTGEKTSEKLNIRFTQPGEYHYRIRRDDSISEKGYTYDETVFKVVVVVDYHNGVFSAEVKVHRGTSEDKIPQIIFEHKYSPSGTCMSNPPVKKAVKGTPKEQSVFEFTMTAASGFLPMPDDSVDGVKTIQIEGSGENEFGEMRFTAPGRYLYTISEVNTGAEGYTYDKMSYTLKCVVTDDKGTLRLTETMTDASGNKVNKAVFTNIYKASGKSDAPGNSGGTSNGGTKGTSGNVKTGDNTDIMIFVVLLLVSLCAGICFAHIKKSRNKKQ